MPLRVRVVMLLSFEIFPEISVKIELSFSSAIIDFVVIKKVYN